MISRTQCQNEATHLINFPAYPPSAQTRAIRGHGPVSLALANTDLAPSRSWIFAGWTTTASTNPSVSTKMCRLTPLTFFLGRQNVLETIRFGSADPLEWVPWLLSLSNFLGIWWSGTTLKHVLPS